MSNTLKIISFLFRVCIYYAQGVDFLLCISGLCKYGKTLLGLPQKRLHRKYYSGTFLCRCCFKFVSL